MHMHVCILYEHHAYTLGFLSYIHLYLYLIICDINLTQNSWQYFVAHMLSNSHFFLKKKGCQIVITYEQNFRSNVILH